MTYSNLTVAISTIALSVLFLSPSVVRGQVCGQVCGPGCGCQSQSTGNVGCSAASAGAGTELKKIYARFGIVPSPTCSCHETARIMDLHPAQWSRDNMAWIECRIEEAAPGLGVKYRPVLARRTIKIAIRRAARQER
jgi:hypothetical protein